MTYPYDAKSPIRRGIVAGHPRQRIEGLNNAQVKAMRNTEDRTPHFHRGGPFSLGMISAVRASYSEHMPIPTKPVFKHRTPGRKRSIGTSCKAPSNMVFQGKPQSQRQLELDRADAILAELKVLYIELQLDPAASDQSYEDKRQHFIRIYRHTHGRALTQMEEVVQWNHRVRRPATSLRSLS